MALTNAQKAKLVSDFLRIYRPVNASERPSDEANAAYAQWATSLSQNYSTEEIQFIQSLIQGTEGLPTDASGNVDPAAYAQYYDALEKDWSTFAEGGDLNAGLPGVQKATPTPSEQMTQNVADFIKFLQQPVDFESPFAKQVLRQAEMDAYRRESGAGARGGLANLNVQQAYMGAAAGLEQQRQNQLLQALGLGSGRDIGLQNVDLANRQFAEQQYQFDTGLDKQQYERDLQNRMALLGLVGGVGGGVAGGLAGGPAGIMPGAQAGSRALAGLGGATASPYTAPMRP